MRVIAYDYEADHHCLECTARRFGPATDDCEDGEGNPIHPVLDTDEWYADEQYLGITGDAQLVCGDCGEVIEEVQIDRDPHVSNTLLRQRRESHMWDHYLDH